METTQTIDPLIAIHRAQLPVLLPANLVGLYLRGSLVMGDFRPESSDIDLLAVTYQRLSDAEFARLAAFHDAIAHRDHPFARRVEIAYIDGASLRRYQPGQRHPTLGQGERLQWTEHYANWLLERWMVREHGIALFGPLPVTLIDPIERAELTSAVRSRLLDWAAWAQDINNPEWQWPRSHKFYIVETMCRVLHTLATGEITSKPQARQWTRQMLPDPWRGLVERCPSWQNDGSRDESLIEPVRAFVLWVAQGANAASPTPD